MTRKSGPAWARSIGGLAALTFLSMGFWTSEAAQDPAPEPPPLSPLSPVPPKGSGAFPRSDGAIERASGEAPARPYGPPAVEALPGALRPTGESSLEPGFLDTLKLPTAAKDEGTPQEASRLQFATAEAFWKLENYRRAYDYYQAAVDSDPDNVPARLGLALALGTFGKLNEALNQLDTIITKHPESAALAYATRAYIRGAAAKNEDRAELDGAEADLGEALKRGPIEPRGRLARALIAKHRGRLDAATSDLDWLIGHEAQPAEALIRRGCVLLDKGVSERALADFERADALHPGWLRPMLLWGRGQCYANRGEFDRALSDLTAAMAGYRDNPGLYQARAACYCKKDDLEHAVADLDTVVRLQPRSPEAYINRCLLLLQKGDSARAMTDLDRLVELSPDSCGSYFWRAVISLTAGKDRQKALADLDRAVRINPRASILYPLRGFLRAQDSRYVPACLDFALFFLTYDPAQYCLSGGIDWEAQRFSVSISWYFPDPAQKPGEKAEAAADSKCFDLAFQQLLTSALVPKR